MKKCLDFKVLYSRIRQPPIVCKIELNNIKTIRFPASTVHAKIQGSMKMCMFGKSGQFILKFNMHHSFRLNITFHHLQVFTVSGNCLKDYFNIAPDNITLCGIHSLIQIYPKDKSILLTVGLYNGIYFDILTTFVLISKGIIVSESILHPPYQQYHLVSVYSLIMVRLLVETYKIQVFKYQGITLKMKRTNDKIRYLLFPGPGFSFVRKRMIIKKGNFIIENFQCSLQIIQSMEYYNNYSFNFHINFKGYMLPIKSIEMEDAILINFPGTHCNFSNKICILLVNTIESSYINFTILSFTFEGFLNSKCEYGGISLQNDKGKNFQESYLLCNKFNYTSEYKHFKLQSIYSNSSLLLIVIYHYQRYSSLAIKASVSTTNCMGVMVDICYLHLVKSNKKIIFSNSILQLVHHVGNNSHITVNLLAKSCFVLQMYSYQVDRSSYSTLVKLKFFSCSLYLKMGLTPTVPVLWKVRSHGFLQSNSVYSHQLIVYGDYKFDKSEIGLKWENGTQHSWGSSLREKQHWFLAPNNNDISFHMQFIMKTPTHKKSMSFHISVYHWSYSWINFLINSTNTVPNQTRIEILSIRTHYPKYIQVDPNETAVMVLNVKTSYPFAVKVKVATYPQQDIYKEYTQFSTIYRAHNQSRDLIIALPGIIHSATLSSVSTQKSVKVIVATTWIYTKHKIKNANKEMYGLKFPNYPFRRRQYIIKHARKGTYHFIKWYKKECFHFEKKWCKMDQLFCNQAAGICKYGGAVLPEFFSRTDQDELLSIIEQSTDLFPIEALFIGLRTPQRPRYLSLLSNNVLIFKVILTLYLLKAITNFQ